MKNFYNKLIAKVKEQMSDGSIDSEHYIAIFYCICIILPLIVTGIGVFLLHIFTNLLLQFVILIIFTVINAWLFVFFGKKFVFYIRNKRFMLSFFSFFTVYLFLLFTLSWTIFFLGKINGLLGITLLPEMNFSKEHPGTNLARSIESFRITSQNMVIFSQGLGFSLLLNIFVPTSLQRVDVSILKKILRLLIKIISLTVIGLILFVLLKTKREDFFAVTAVYGVLTALADPKKIINIFTNLKNIEDKVVSTSIMKSFNAFKLFLSEFYIAWVFSIIIFDSDADQRLNLFSIILLIFVVITVAVKIYFQLNGEDFFSTWWICVNKVDSFFESLFETNPLSSCFMISDNRQTKNV